MRLIDKPRENEVAVVAASAGWFVACLAVFVWLSIRWQLPSPSEATTLAALHQALLLLPLALGTMVPLHALMHCEKKRSFRFRRWFSGAWKGGVAALSLAVFCGVGQVFYSSAPPDDVSAASAGPVQEFLAFAFPVLALAVLAWMLGFHFFVPLIQTIREGRTRAQPTAGRSF